MEESYTPPFDLPKNVDITTFNAPADLLGIPRIMRQQGVYREAGSMLNDVLNRLTEERGVSDPKSHRAETNASIVTLTKWKKKVDEHNKKNHDAGLATYDIPVDLEKGITAIEPYELRPTT